MWYYFLNKISCQLAKELGLSQLAVEEYVISLKQSIGKFYPITF